MDRRDVVRALALLVVAPASPIAGGERRLPRVIFLLTGSEALAQPFVTSFREGLRAAGQVEGKTLVLDVRFNNYDPSTLDAAMRRAVGERPDVLVVAGLAAARRARELTKTLPVVVATASDLVDAGVVESYARPGGNVTGVSDLTDEGATKRLEMIRRALPTARRVALLVNPAFPATPKIERSVGEAAASLGLAIVTLRASNPAELAAAIDSLAASPPDAVLVGGDPLFNAGDFIDRAIVLRVPVVHYWPGMAEKGALLSYEVDVHDNFRRAAGYVDKVLKGAKPADLPIHRPTRYVLKVNTNTARRLGVALPESFRLSVDQFVH